MPPRHQTPEARARISAALKGRPKSEETRRRLSEVQKGKPRGPLPQETRDKISRANKGKPKPPRTAEHRRHLSEAHTGRSLTAEHRRHISEALLALPESVKERMRWTNPYPHSEEQRQKISRGVRADWETRPKEERIRRLRAAWVAAGTADSSIERQTASALEDLGVPHERQYAIPPYRADFFLPEWRIVLECDGTYWHGTPEAHARDERRDAFMKNAGYRVARIREEDINRDVMGALRCAIPELSAEEVSEYVVSADSL